MAYNPQQQQQQQHLRNGPVGDDQIPRDNTMATYEVEIDDTKTDLKPEQSADEVVLYEQQQHHQQGLEQQEQHESRGEHDGSLASLDNGQTNLTDSRQQQLVNDRTTRSKSQPVVVGPGEKKSIGHPFKVPLLKQFYTFGPWVGRNRKAQCNACQHQSCSSQPDRLLKHLRRCTALSQADRNEVENILNERTATKKTRKTFTTSRMSIENNLDNSAGFNLEDDNSNQNCTLDSANISSVVIAPSSNKRYRRDHPERKAHLDELLTRFIMVNRIPLKSIHSKEFTEFVRSLDPDYRIPTREHITNVLIPGLLDIL